MPRELYQPFVQKVVDQYYLPLFVLGLSDANEPMLQIQILPSYLQDLARPLDDATRTLAANPGHYQWESVLGVSLDFCV